LIYLDNKVTTVLANKLPIAPANWAIPSNNNSIGSVNEGFIQSARFPAAYPRGIRQNLTIVGDLDSALRLQFDDFHLHYISELKASSRKRENLANYFVELWPKYLTKIIYQYQFRYIK